MEYIQGIIQRFHHGSAGGNVVGPRMTMILFPIVGLLIVARYFRKGYILTEQKREEIAAEVRKRK